MFHYGGRGVVVTYLVVRQKSRVRISSFTRFFESCSEIMTNKKLIQLINEARRTLKQTDIPGQWVDAVFDSALWNSNELSKNQRKQIMEFVEEIKGGVAQPGQERFSDKK